MTCVASSCATTTPIAAALEAMRDTWTRPPVYMVAFVLDPRAMDTISGMVTAPELRGQLSDVLARVMDGGERIGVTRNGTLAAFIVGVADLEALEELEMAQDVRAYGAAKAEDDGERVLLGELRDELAG